MRKERKLLSVMILGILSMVLLLSVTIPINFTTRASVPYSLHKTMEQLTSAVQLPRWFLPFANQDSTRYSIIALPSPSITAPAHELKLISATPSEAVISFKHEDDRRRFRFVASPDSRKKGASVVSLTLSNTLWKQMLDQDEVEKEVIRSLKNLESFTNDTRRFYGYEIRRDNITDSSLLFITTSIEPTQKAAASRILFDSLLVYVKNKGIAHNGKRLFYSQPIKAGELQIFAGLSVQSTVTPKPSDGITKKTIPTGSKMLVANFKGPYKNIETVYRALEKYRSDYALVSTAIPFEDFQTAGYGFNPDEVVEIKVCYPIN